MLSLRDKNMVVIGGSRGVGRRIVEAGIRNGALVLAVARQEGPLRQLAHEVSGTEVLALDATEEGTPSEVFGLLQPDILVLCAGAFPPAAPLHEQSWQEFAVNWESDVKIAFHFCKAALLRPLPAGALVILISSGAALAGSPNSGGYAGAKRTQIFIANYSQKESDRLGWRLRRALCRIRNSENMRSRGIPAILVYPRLTSFRAWLRRRRRPMSRPRSSSWLRAQIAPKEKCSSYPGKASKS